MKLDALICPVYPHSAFKHEDEELAFQVNFLAPWNVLDYPSGSVPITEVKEGEDRPEDYNDTWNDVLTTKFRNSIRGSVGMPIGVQVVTPKWKDEQCLAVMKLLGDAVNHNQLPPVAQ